MACYWSSLSFPLFSFQLSCNQISESTSHTPSPKIANASMINMKEPASCALHIWSQLFFKMIQVANTQLRIISAWPDLTDLTWLQWLRQNIAWRIRNKNKIFFFYFWWEVGFSMSTSGSVFVSEKKMWVLFYYNRSWVILYYRTLWRYIINFFPFLNEGGRIQCSTNTATTCTNAPVKYVRATQLIKLYLSLSVAAEFVQNATEIKIWSNSPQPTAIALRIVHVSGWSFHSKN